MSVKKYIISIAMIFALIAVSLSAVSAADANDIQTTTENTTFKFGSLPSPIGIHEIISLGDIGNNILNITEGSATIILPKHKTGTVIDDLNINFLTETNIYNQVPF